MQQEGMDIVCKDDCRALISISADSKGPQTFYKWELQMLPTITAVKQK